MVGAKGKTARPRGPCVGSIPTRPHHNRKETGMRMLEPTVTIERDASIQAWEVAIECEDDTHDLFKILFFDDGHTEFWHWTREEWAAELSGAVVDAIKGVGSRFKD